MDGIQNEQLKAEVFPKSEKIEKGSDGWLSPRGDYYKVGSNQHDASANYLMGNSHEVKEEERMRFSHDWLRRDYDGKNNREKLKELGWILVRGDILRSEDALNFTPVQLKAISEAEIKVISAFDGSVEYSSDEVQDVLKRVQTDLNQSKLLQQLHKDLENGKFSQWFTSFRERTAGELENFRKDPFRTTIYTAEVYDWHNPNEHEALPTEILDILSKGSFEEMKMLLGRSEYTFRVVDLKTGGKIWVEREEYFHDGLSGGMNGDYNNYISMYVVDDILMREKLSKLIKDRTEIYKPPEITFQVKGGYFEKFFSGILKQK